MCESQEATGMASFLLSRASFGLIIVCGGVAVHTHKLPSVLLLMRSAHSIIAGCANIPSVSISQKTTNSCGVLEGNKTWTPVLSHLPSS